MSSTPKSRILIVDDDRSIRTMVAISLAAQGYEISSAVDGFEALLQMKSSLPKLVISDLNMPRMSGFEFSLRAPSALSRGVGCRHEWRI